MKKQLFIQSALILAFALLIGQSCREKESTSATSTTQSLDPGAFEEKLNNTTVKILLDVRTPEEYQQEHLAEATLMDFRSADFSKQVSTLDKSKPIFVYCAVGGRSEKAASILKDQGFTEIIQLKGGISEWINANKPVVKE